MSDIIDPIVPIDPAKPEPKPKKKLTQQIDEQPLEELTREIERLTAVVKDKDTEIIKGKEAQSALEAALKAFDIKSNSKSNISALEIAHRLLHPYLYENPYEFLKPGKVKE